MGLMTSLFGPTQGEVRGAQAWLEESANEFDRTRSGVDINEARAMTLSAVFACVRAIAEDTAKLPLKLYGRMEPQGKEVLRADPLHRLVALTPNDEMGSFDCRQAIIANAIMWHGGFAEITRGGGGQPRGLWPIHASRVLPDRNDDNQLIYRVWDGNWNDGDERAIPARDMIHVKGFGDNGLVGFMVAKFAKESWGIYKAAETFTAAFFGNGAMPRGVIEFPAEVDNEKANAFIKKFQERHGGPAKSHQWTILNLGAQAKQMSFDAEQAQLTEALQFRVEDVARWFRVPPHKIQHLLRATFNNIEHMSLEYLQDTISPWLIRVEQEFDRKLLLADPDRFFEHTRDAIVQSDITSRYNAYQVAVTNGWMSRNEVRDKENMNPYAGGDDMLVQQNLATVHDDGTITPNNETGELNEPGAAEAPGVGIDVEQAKVLMMPVFVDAARRCLTREVDAITRKKPPITGQWLGEFYSRHRESIVSTFAAPAETLSRMAGVEPDGVLDRYADMHAAESTRQISEAQDVAAVLERWQTERAAWIARHLTDEVCNG